MNCCNKELEHIELNFFRCSICDRHYRRRMKKDDWSVESPSKVREEIKRKLGKGTIE